MTGWFDALSVLLFLGVYQGLGLFTAIGVTMVAYVLHTVVYSLWYRTVDPIQWSLCAVVVVCGTLSLACHNALFFKWKPSVVYWLMALGLRFGHVCLKNRAASGPVLQHWAAQHVTLPVSLWWQLTNQASLFLAGLGALNVWVAYHASTQVWVYFKVFGLLPLVILFGAWQAYRITQCVDHRGKSDGTTPS